jgi:PepSY-associated TM region
MAALLSRATVIVHRYLGIAIGLLMVMWFISGIVMMYVPYTRVREAERLHIQPPISWQSCCNYGGLSDDVRVTRAQVEDHLGAPALRPRLPGQPDFLFDLSSGTKVPIDADTARNIVLEAARGVIGQPAPITAYEQVPLDQFTLGRAPRDRPFHRFIFGDSERTTIYVSGTTGQVVTWTTATERFWNWLGTIPHFLYFQSLRVQQKLWSQTVIWTSLLGGFLTVVGIILGIVQFGRQEWENLAISWLVLLASCTRSRFWRAHAELDLQRPRFDEPVGISRRPRRRRRDKLGTGAFAAMGNRSKRLWKHCERSLQEAAR